MAKSKLRASSGPRNGGDKVMYPSSREVSDAMGERPIRNHQTKAGLSLSVFSDVKFLVPVDFLLF
jgi:hypothetical protein